MLFCTPTNIGDCPPPPCSYAYANVINLLCGISLLMRHCFFGNNILSNLVPRAKSSCHTKGCDSLSKGRYDETFAGEDGAKWITDNS